MNRRLLVPAACLVVLAAATTAGASAKWREMRNVSGGETCCIRVDGQLRDYVLLTGGDAAVVHVRGPRRLRILSRAAPGGADAAETAYALRLRVDGVEVDLKRYEAAPAAGAAFCDGGDGAVGGLRRAYLTLPDGLHEVMVGVESAEGDRVALRLFQEARRRRDERISLSPETYADVMNLQFDSGSSATYYTFTDAQPLAFRVTGPTTVELWTRLDFDLTMSGRQTYVVDVLVDGVSTGLRHYDTDKLDAAAYIERDDVLPGERKTLRIELDKGRHRVELRCVRPEACCVAAKIWLPAGDLR